MNPQQRKVYEERLANERWLEAKRLQMETQQQEIKAKKLEALLKTAPAVPNKPLYINPQNSMNQTWFTASQNKSNDEKSKILQARMKEQETQKNKEEKQKLWKIYQEEEFKKNTLGREEEVKKDWERLKQMMKLYEKKTGGLRTRKFLNKNKPHKKFTKRRKLTRKYSLKKKTYKRR